MNDIKVVAVLTIKQQYAAVIIPELKKLVDSSKAEKGCHQYELNQNKDNPLEFIFIERWASTEAIDIHNQSVHFQAFGHFIADKLVSLDVKVIEPFLFKSY